jgi:YHS domain-containing protein
MIYWFKKKCFVCGLRVHHAFSFRVYGGNKVYFCARCYAEHFKKNRLRAVRKGTDKALGSSETHETGGSTMRGSRSTVRGGEDVAKEKIWRCQFCGRLSSPRYWKNDECPFCHQKYDWLLAQESEED